METIKNRAGFLAAANGRKAVTPGFILQAVESGEDGVRVGFTCSKKIGNAVARNLAKRRLREVARSVLPEQGQAGWDYVLIGRTGQAGSRDLDAMRADLQSALARIHSEPDADATPSPI